MRAATIASHTSLYMNASVLSLRKGMSKTRETVSATGLSSALVNGASRHVMDDAIRDTQFDVMQDQRTH